MLLRVLSLAQSQGRRLGTGQGLSVRESQRDTAYRLSNLEYRVPFSTGTGQKAVVMDVDTE